MADYRRVAIYLGCFIGPLSGNAVLALVPSLTSEFDASAAEVLLSITFFMLPFAVFMLFSGTWSDVIGRKKVLSIGFIIYAVGSVLTASSTELWFFYMARTVTGLGFAFVQPVLMAMLGDIVPAPERGRAMGLLGAATTAGIAMGPFLAGFLSTVNWRLTFFVIAILAMAVWVMVVFACTDIVPTGRRADTRAFISALKVGAKDPGMMFLALTGFLTFLCYIGTQSFLSAAVSSPPLSLSEEDIGLVLASAGLAGIVVAPIGGHMVDRFGAVPTAVIGYGVMCLAFLLMTMAGTMSGYMLSLIVLGSGSALVWAPLLSLAVAMLPGLKGTSSSIFNSARFLGYAAAPLFFTPLYTNIGFDAVNTASAAVAIMAVIALMATRRIMRRRPNPAG